MILIPFKIDYVLGTRVQIKRRPNILKHFVVIVDVLDFKVVNVLAGGLQAFLGASNPNWWSKLRIKIEHFTRQKTS